MVVQPRFSASRFWEVSLRNRCTWCSLIPFCVKALLDVPKPDEPHHYRFWGPAISLPEASAHFGIAIFGWWGMTETITQGIVGDPAYPGPRLCIGRRRPATTSPFAATMAALLSLESAVRSSSAACAA